MGFSYAYSLKSQEVTLTNCDREPVHVPGCIQPFGVLMALRASDFTLLQMSDNAMEWLGQTPQALLGKSLADIVGAPGEKVLRQTIAEGKLGSLPRFLFTFETAQGKMDALGHQQDGMILIEAETANDIHAGAHAYAEVNRIAGTMHRANGLYNFCQTLADEIRGLTGLDRVMIYRFHEDQSGEVFAEAKREDLHSYYTLRYPSEDIPAPAREIFRKIWVRPVPAVNYTQSELVPLLNPDTDKPLDMTYSFLRGASVMYTDYLKNMGVEMALTLSIVVDGALWGLVACHHTEPKIIPWTMRVACELLAQIASLQLKTAESTEFTDVRFSMEKSSDRLVSQMLNRDESLSNILAHTPTALDFIESTGVALFENGEWIRHGTTPDKRELDALATWLGEVRAKAPIGTELLHTHALAEWYPPAKAYAKIASGLLAAPISGNGEDVILWFRPEVTQLVNWAGDPHSKTLESSPHGDRLLPRTSFALWQESVRGQSTPWKSVEIEAARRMRLSIIEIVVARAQSIALLNKELSISNEELDSFAYVTSHDLREPLRGIYHYAHYLQENSAARGDAEATEQTRRLTVLVKRMDGLIESLLHFSRVGRVTLERQMEDMKVLAEEALDILYARIKETKPDIRFVTELPPAACDAIRMREVWTNLIGNALKYNESTPPIIELGYEMTTKGGAYFVRDNGIGISPADQPIVFNLFKRLHAKDDFGGGSGAGLPIVKKIVERHGGIIWLESKLGQGTTFYFTVESL